jgi:hypothetical protein
MTEDRLANNQAGLTDIHADGQGVWRASIYSTAGIRQVYADARGGDAEAIEIAQLFDLYFAGVWRITTSGLLRCIACPCVFNLGHLPAGLSVLAAVEQPHDRFVAGICRSCAGRSDLKDAIQVWCRKMFGNARSVQTGTAGRAGLEALHAEGQGVWRLGLYPRAGIAGIAVAAKEHPAAAALMSSINAYTQSIHDRATTDPLRCLMCVAAFDLNHGPAALSALSGAVPTPEHYLIGGICASCWSQPDAKRNIREALAAGLGVKMRLIDIGPAGHA